MKQKKSHRGPRLSILGLLALLAPLTGVGGLRNVWLKTPVAVAPGQSATLVCSYDLENEPLYTVKWYKGRQEFFRYIPKEHPNTRVFLQPGINVDLAASGEDRVVLRDVDEHMGGKYRCEVSTDAPHFHTIVVSAYMHVVHMPEGKPILRLEKYRYSIGDVIRGNCTSPPSNPPANITWVINGNTVNSSYISKILVDKKYQTIALLEYEVNAFTPSKMKVLCIADVFGVYSTQEEVTVDEERPKIASVLGGGSGKLQYSFAQLVTFTLSIVLLTR